MIAEILAPPDTLSLATIPQGAWLIAGDCHLVLLNHLQPGHPARAIMPHEDAVQTVHGPALVVGRIDDPPRARVAASRVIALTEAYRCQQQAAQQQRHRDEAEAERLHADPLRRIAELELVVVELHERITELEAMIIGQQHAEREDDEYE